MADVNIKVEYPSGEKTEIAMLETILGSGTRAQRCVVFDFKSLSKNDLLQLLNALNMWIVNNYKPELHPTWSAKEQTNIIYFDPHYEKIEETVSSILSVLKNRNQKVKMEILIKEAEEKTKLLKEAGKKVPHWVEGTTSHTCSEKCESKSTNQRL